jgi:hypothetical protein
MKTAYAYLGIGALLALLGLDSALRSGGAHGSHAVVWVVALVFLTTLLAGAVRLARALRGSSPPAAPQAVLYLAGSALILVHLALELPSMIGR